MEKLKPNLSYHIFYHANRFENIFIDNENYRFFMDKYDLYIRPVAETYAYCLLPNHFHLVVRIRKIEAIKANFSKVWNFGKAPNFGKVI
jgi:REP element-mobilizing transposase RayT